MLTRSLQRITPARRRLLASAAVAAPPSPTREGREEPTSAGRGSEAGLAPPATLAPPPALRPRPRYGRSPRLQQEQRARHAARVHRDQQGKTRCAQGQSLRQIAAACGLDTKTVRSWVRTETLALDQRGYRGAGKIDAYMPSLRTRLAEGCPHQSRLWRAIRAHGFTGTRALVAQWSHAHGRHTPVAPPPAALRQPAARQLAWLLVQDTEQRSAAEQGLVAQLQQHTELTHVQQLVQQGTAMIRQRRAADLDVWLQTCQASPSVEVQNFADVLQRDYAAVKAALTLPWSTGPVEGHINRLKLIKRSGYGRMQLDLLRQRVLYDAA